MEDNFFWKGEKKMEINNSIQAICSETDKAH